MNVYDKMLKQFYKEKGESIRKYTKEEDLEGLLKTLSTVEKIKEKYGIDFNDSKIFSSFNVTNIYRFNAQVYMSGGDGYIGTISEIYNSDKQPSSPQLLLKISHSTGAYIFGDYYPTDLFNEFFDELRAKTKVEYVDVCNHSLYYTLENAMEAITIYKEVYKEYIEKNKENYKKVMIEKKKLEIERLQKELDK